MPILYQRVNCHINFDINMEDFCNKARLVEEGLTEKASSHNNLRRRSVAGESPNCFEIRCFEQFSCEGSGHSEFLNHSACHRVNMDRTGS